jgi:hypothetical protein
VPSLLPMLTSVSIAFLSAKDKSFARQRHTCASGTPTICHLANPSVIRCSASRKMSSNLGLQSGDGNFRAVTARKHFLTSIVWVATQSAKPLVWLQASRHRVCTVTWCVAVPSGVSTANPAPSLAGAGACTGCCDDKDLLADARQPTKDPPAAFLMQLSTDASASLGVPGAATCSCLASLPARTAPSS